MGGDGITRMAEAWATVWSVALMAGYLAEATPWGWMKVLRERAVLKGMLLSTGAVVVGLALGGVFEQGAMLATWGVVCASVKLLCDALVPAEE
jgi:hypothetical protein